MIVITSFIIFTYLSEPSLLSVGKLLLKLPFRLVTGARGIKREENHLFAIGGFLFLLYELKERIKNLLQEVIMCGNINNKGNGDWRH